MSSAMPGTAQLQAFTQSMKSLRNRHDLSQTELARRMTDAGHNFHQQTVQKIESGTRPVRLDEAVDIAGILETSVADMTTPAQWSQVLRPLLRHVTRMYESLVSVTEGRANWLESHVLLREHLLPELDKLDVPVSKNDPLADTYRDAVEQARKWTATANPEQALWDELTSRVRSQYPASSDDDSAS